MVPLWLEIFFSGLITVPTSNVWPPMHQLLNVYFFPFIVHSPRSSFKSSSVSALPSGSSVKLFFLFSSFSSLYVIPVLVNGLRK